MSASPPLRFLALAAGGWVCLRAAMLLPPWWREAGPAAVPIAPPAAARLAPIVTARLRPPRPSPRRTRPAVFSLIRELPYKGVESRARAALPLPVSESPLPWQLPDDGPAEIGLAVTAAPPTPLPSGMPDALPPAPSRRWAVSAWLLVRDERGAPALAPGGSLGGSQAGARMTYRLGERLALSGRLSLPLRRTQGAEAAAGLDWQPFPSLPIHLLAERRQDLGGEGRSAFALLLHGGIDRPLPRRLRIEAYAQAGVVGTGARDLFADGAARLTAPLGPVALGGGAWGGAQPGAARLDAGPTLSWRLPVRGAQLRLQADWRFRIAGDAAPGSGPALTVSAGF